MSLRVELEVEIAEIGARGDGIARLETGERLYVPYTLPGDRVRVRLGRKRPDGFVARVATLLTAGPGRAEPPCRHFGACGGCALQHLAPGSYRDWKLALLERALARQGIAAGAILPLVATPPARRRRADFTALRRKSDMLLGFNAPLSHEIIDLAECPVLLPAIAALLPALRDMLAALLAPSERAEVKVTASDSGLDLLLVTGIALGAKRRERLAAFAEAQDLARVARLHPKGDSAEPIVERRPVLVRFGPVSVTLPPGAFLQATREGERALQAAVARGVGDGRRVADLYAGCGSLGLPLAAAGHGVHAVEGDRAAVETLERMARESAGRLRLTVARRDLDRRPLMDAELERFDAVIFDPPRAGAPAQAEALAQSGVPRIIAISCNPASFARDAKALAEGGYRLDWVQPVDQFLWSPHLELAALFTR
jgi:23S rRNA (uracil1939-C5)-methyltransferase